MINYFYVSILCILVVTTAHELSMDFCSEVEIEKAKRECNDVYAGGNPVNLNDLCLNVECYLQCLHDAIGDCSNRDMFYKEDIEMFKALFRAKCENHTSSQIADEVCQVQTPCINVQFHKEQVVTMNKLKNESHAIEIKELQCRWSAKSKACTMVKPNKNCTPEMAELRKNIEIIENSISQCNISQDHPFFDKYGGEIKCTSPKLRSKCFTASVMSRMAKCTPVTLSSFINEDKRVVENICNDVECTSQCYANAVGECYDKDQYVMLDPEMIKISIRAACDNIEGLESTIHQCKMSDTSCLYAFGKSLTSAHMLITSERYKEYKNLVCSAASKFRSCIVFDVNSNCMATFAKSLYEVWHSYSGCGKPNNKMFQTYSGKSTCDSSGSLHFPSFINIILLYIIYNYVD